MRSFLKILASLAFLAGTFFLYLGYDKKENYNNPERTLDNIENWWDTKNVYVGGDAYNYIINSNYFTGYNVLGIGCYLISVLGLTGDAILGRLDDHNTKAEQYYGYIYHHPMFKNFGEKNDQKAKDKKFSASDWGQLPDLNPSDSGSMRQKQDTLPDNSKSQNNPSQSSNNNIMYPSSNFQNNPQSMQQTPNYPWQQASYPYSPTSQIRPAPQFAVPDPNMNLSNQPSGNSQNSNDKGH